MRGFMSFIVGAPWIKQCVLSEIGFPQDFDS